MECQLFYWDGWDGEPLCMTFYKVVLKQQIGKYPPGTKFDNATILQDPEQGNGTLQLMNHGEFVNGSAPNIVMGEYRLHYRVGETLDEQG